MTDRVDLSEFISGFVTEADEHLRASRASLLALDEASGERKPRVVRELYRSLHTIKGLAAMVGVQPVVDVAHRMETVLRAADRARGTLPANAVEPLFAALEALETRVAAVGRGERAAPAPQKLLASLDALETPEVTRSEASGLRLTLEGGLAAKVTAEERDQIFEAVRAGRRALRVTFVPSTERSEAGITITTVRERLGKVTEIVRVLPASRPRGGSAPAGLAFELLLVTDADDEAVLAAAQVEPASLAPLVDAREELDDVEDEPEPGEPGGAAANVVRVDVRRLDRAMQRLSSLVVTRFKLGRAIAALSERGADVRELRLVADEHARQLRDMREAIFELRMVPVSEVLDRIPLVVRGLRSSTGKDVRVETAVGHAELDKSVAERLFPVIVHLVRNAVDHGIEPAGARRAAGKPEQGLLRISASEAMSDKLVLTIEDDGAGVDAGAVARRAGRPVPENDAGLLDLLVRPGLSTRATPTTTSGRGMGMDIVHRVVVRELGGELWLENREGFGAKFVLRVPLTVSIIDSIGFTCAGQAFVVPLTTVEEVCDLDEVRVVTAPSPAGVPRRMIERKGEIAAYHALGGLFALDESGVRKVVFVRRNGVPVGFGVDRMIGQQEVVVRPLEDPLVRAPGVTGATDLGDGRPTLVLDLCVLSADAASAPAGGMGA